MHIISPATDPSWISGRTTEVSGRTVYRIRNLWHYRLLYAARQANMVMNLSLSTCVPISKEALRMNTSEEYFSNVPELRRDVACHYCRQDCRTLRHQNSKTFKSFILGCNTIKEIIKKRQHYNKHSFKDFFKIFVIVCHFNLELFVVTEVALWHRAG